MIYSISGTSFGLLSGANGGLVARAGLMMEMEKQTSPECKDGVVVVSRQRFRGEQTGKASSMRKQAGSELEASTLNREGLVMLLLISEE